MRFVALDVETANKSAASICQVGLVVFDEGKEVFATGSLIDCGNPFEAVNVGIHGITAAKCRGAPTFAQFCRTILHLLDEQTLACHSDFDRSALAEACEATAQRPLTCSWIDTADIARAVWPDLQTRGGFGLPNLAERLSLGPYRAHDAESDARMAGMVLIRAAAFLGITDIAAMRTIQPGELPRLEAKQAAPKKKVLFAEKRLGAMPPTGAGPLSGHTVVFTGDLPITRIEAAGLATQAGATVEGGVNARTTILVAGPNDPSVLRKGETKSAKQVKAEKMNDDGAMIAIITPAQFLARVGKNA